MEGNIQGLNLIQLEQDYNQYVNLAYNLALAVQRINTRIKALTKCWTGKRVNGIINLWNTNYPSLNEKVHYFDTKVVNDLSTIIKQYKTMEGITSTTMSVPATVELKKVASVNNNVISFDKGQASNIIRNISNDNNNVISYLKVLSTKLDSIQSYSDKLKAFLANYKLNCSSLQKTITSICSTINDEAKKALNDVITTETYNELDAKKASSKKI